MAFQWAQSDRKFVWHLGELGLPRATNEVHGPGVFFCSDQPITDTVMSTNFINVLPFSPLNFSCSGLVCLPFWLFWTRTRSNSGYLQCIVYWFNQEEWVLWHLESQYSAQEPPFEPPGKHKYLKNIILRSIYLRICFGFFSLIKLIVKWYSQQQLLLLSLWR